MRLDYMIILGTYKRSWYVHSHPFDSVGCQLDRQAIVGELQGATRKTRGRLNRRIKRCQKILKMLDEIRLHEK